MDSPSQTASDVPGHGRDQCCARFGRNAFADARTPTLRRVVVRWAGHAAWKGSMTIVHDAVERPCSTTEWRSACLIKNLVVFHWRTGGGDVFGHSSRNMVLSLSHTP